jgi:hypothetical protein
VTPLNYNICYRITNTRSSSSNSSNNSSNNRCQEWASGKVSIAVELLYRGKIRHCHEKIETKKVCFICQWKNYNQMQYN